MINVYSMLGIISMRMGICLNCFLNVVSSMNFHLNAPVHFVSLRLRAYLNGRDAGTIARFAFPSVNFSMDPLISFFAHLRVTDFKWQFKFFSNLAVLWLSYTSKLVISHPVGQKSISGWVN